MKDVPVLSCYHSRKALVYTPRELLALDKAALDPGGHAVHCVQFWGWGPHFRAAHQHPQWQPKQGVRLAQGARPGQGTLRAVGFAGRQLCLPGEDRDFFLMAQKRHQLNTQGT